MAALPYDTLPFMGTSQIFLISYIFEKLDQICSPRPIETLHLIKYCIVHLHDMKNN